MMDMRQLTKGTVGPVLPLCCGLAFTSDGDSVELIDKSLSGGPRSIALQVDRLLGIRSRNMGVFFDIQVRSLPLRLRLLGVYLTMVAHGGRGVGAGVKSDPKGLAC